MRKRGCSHLPAEGAVPREVLEDAVADVARGRQVLCILPMLAEHPRRADEHVHHQKGAQGRGGTQIATCLTSYGNSIGRLQTDQAQRLQDMSHNSGSYMYCKLTPNVMSTDRTGTSSLP